MVSSFRISSIVPSGLVVESVIEFEDIIKVTARSRTSEALCPSCGSISRQVHSRYIRQVADLPCIGRRVALSVLARRFFCRAENCPRQIFTERFDRAVLASHARRRRG
jgi:transposase